MVTPSHARGSRVLSFEVEKVPPPLTPPNVSREACIRPKHVYLARPSAILVVRAGEVRLPLAFEGKSSGLNAVARAPEPSSARI